MQRLPARRRRRAQRRQRVLRQRQQPLRIAAREAPAPRHLRRSPRIACPRSRAARRSSQSASGASASSRARRSCAGRSRHDLRQHAGLDHQRERRQRILRLQQLAHLGLHPLARQLRDLRRGRGAGRKRLGIGRRRGRSARGSGRSAGCARNPRRCAPPPARRSGSARRRDRRGRRNSRTAGPRVAAHRVDREVAPRRVRLKIVGERHARMPAVGGDVAPQRGDLEAARVGHRRHRAVREPGRDHPEPCGLEQGARLLRRLGRGEVELAARQLAAEQRRRARSRRRSARALPPAMSACQHPPALGRDQPGLAGQRTLAAAAPWAQGSVVPGTTWPSSTRAAHRSRRARSRS